LLIGAAASAGVFTLIVFMSLKTTTAGFPPSVAIIPDGNPLPPVTIVSAPAVGSLAGNTVPLKYPHDLCALSVGKLWRGEIDKFTRPSEE
jgi:hypothetical protein